MLYYEKINVSEGIGITKSDKSKECMVCHYGYFFDLNYAYESYVCNGFHDM